MLIKKLKILRSYHIKELYIIFYPLLVTAVHIHYFRSHGISLCVIKPHLLFKR